MKELLIRRGSRLKLREKDFMKQMDLYAGFETAGAWMD